MPNSALTGATSGRRMRFLRISVLLLRGALRIRRSHLSWKAKPLDAWRGAVSSSFMAVGTLDAPSASYFSNLESIVRTNSRNWDM